EMGGIDDPILMLYGAGSGGINFYAKGTFDTPVLEIGNIEILGGPPVLRGLAEPVQDNDAATKKYVDDIAVSNMSNPNLLDNWYFADPINQRGQTEYGEGPSIDRWNVTSGGKLNVNDGYVTFSGSGVILWFQSTPIKNFGGNTFTLSVLTREGELWSVTAELVGTGDISHEIHIGNSDWRVDIWEVNGELKPRIYKVSSNNSSISLLAMKLEYGTQQTLAHWDESGKWVLNDRLDRPLELIKCQRYQYVGKSVDYVSDLYYFGPNIIGFKISIPSVLRANPAFFPANLAVQTLNNVANDGFTFETEWTDSSHVYVLAKKTGHGMSPDNVRLKVGAPIVFDANL
ncbi:MAG: hypothetical protein K2H70_00730, partial [Bacteroidales bacterium]|nr:hypothetical protein [Bacteroidales bacterium]